MDDSLPMWRRWWRRITHCGVTEALPRNDVKYVVVTNVFALACMSLMLVYPFVNWSLAHPASRALAVVELCSVPLFGLCLYLNHCRLCWAAPCVLILTGLAVVTTAVVLVGKCIGSQLFYIVLAIVPFLMFPRRYLRFAAVVSSLGFIATMVSVIIAEYEPLFGGPIQAITAQNSYMWSLGGMYLASILIGYHARQITQTVEDDLDRERARSERLLLNTLPAPIAGRLKDSEGIIADHFDEVTVLFADIVDFTSMAEGLSPKETVYFLNSVFSTLDHMVEQFGLEKIKTIGDAYMVAGGIPHERKDHAEAVMAFAIELTRRARRITRPDGKPLQLRIGINSGPIVAGVIGVRKFIYDLWGDVVNTASRMESHGESDCIHVARGAYERLKDLYHFESRGKISIKGKGDMETWLYRVSSPKSATKRGF